MKPEDQVCTFEQAKKLKDLGINTNSFFVWDKQNKNLWTKQDHGWPSFAYQAYTVAELGGLLPLKIMHDLFSYKIVLSRGISGFRVKYRTYGISGPHDLFETGIFEQEAQARASALIWLLENNYIKPEDLKL